MECNPDFFFSFSFFDIERKGQRGETQAKFRENGEEEKEKRKWKKRNEKKEGEKREKKKRREKKEKKEKKKGKKTKQKEKKRRKKGQKRFKRGVFSVSFSLLFFLFRTSTPSQASKVKLFSIFLFPRSLSANMSSQISSKLNFELAPNNLLNAVEGEVLQKKREGNLCWHPFCLFIVVLLYFPFTMGKQTTPNDA